MLSVTLSDATSNFGGSVGCTLMAASLSFHAVGFLVVDCCVVVSGLDMLVLGSGFER